MPLNVVQPGRLDVSSKSKIYDFSPATLRCDTPVAGTDVANKNFVTGYLTTVAWGSITGSLVNQIDLITALGNKYDASNPSGYISDLSTFTTTDLAEGTNLYYTDVRARAGVAGMGLLSFTNNAGFITNLSTFDTDDLAEGSTNKYDKTVALTAGANITITGTYPNFTIASTGGGGIWGTITGTLSNQTDFQNALNLKYDASNPDGYLTAETDPIFTAWLAVPPNISTFTNDSGYISDLSSVLALDQITPQTFTGGVVTGTGFLIVTAGELGLDTNTYLTVETDPLSIHLDQTSPQTFTGGMVTGTGILKVTAGELGLDTSTYLTVETDPVFMSYLDTDTTLAADSDSKVASQHAVKTYVDNGIAYGTSWKMPVLGQQTTPPVSPTLGDRYIVTSVATGAWTGQEDNIAEYNGATWDFFTPSTGWAVVDTSSGSGYSYNAAGNWVLISQQALYTAGNALSLVINEFNVLYDDSSIGIDGSNQLYVKALGVTNAMLAGSISDSKLSQITTASKVSGAAITLLGSLPAGAGADPVVNGGTGLTSLGTSNQLLGVASGATGMEYKTLVAGTNMTITHAAGSITLDASGGGGGIADYVYTETVFHSHPASALAYTNLPAALTEWPSGSVVMRKKVNLTGAVQFRLMATQSVAGFAGSKIRLRYSTNNSTFNDLDSDTSGDLDVGTGTGVKVGAWTNIVAGAKQEVWLSIFGISGNGVVDPAFRQLYAEFKYNSSYVEGGSGGTIYTEQVIHAHPASALAYTNLPAAVAEFPGNTRARFAYDATNSSAYRITVHQAVAGFAGSDLNLQYYLTGGSTWNAADSAGAGELDVGTGTGMKTGSWATLVAGAKTDALWRLVAKDGNGVVDPSWYEVKVQFKQTPVSGSGGTPGGIEKSVQYNNPLGTFDGASTFLFDEATNTLSLDGIFKADRIEEFTGSAGGGFQSKAFIDVTDTEAFLVRKNADGGDVFTVNTTAGTVTIGPSGTSYTLPAVRGTNGQVPQTDGSGNVSWATVVTAPAGSDGFHQYNNGGVFGASSLYYDDVNDEYRIDATGLASGLSRFIIGGATTAKASLYMIESSGDTNYPIFGAMKTRGTVSSPTATQSGDYLVALAGGGYSGALAGSGVLGFQATQTWASGTPNKQGTQFFVNVTADDTATQITGMTIGQDRRVGFFGGINESVFSTDSNPAYLYLSKYRGTQSSPTAVATNDNIAEIRARGYDGDSIETTAQIYAVATENYTNSNRGSKWIFTTTPTGTTLTGTALAIENDRTINMYGPSLFQNYTGDWTIGTVARASGTGYSLTISAGNSGDADGGNLNLAGGTPGGSVSVYAGGSGDNWIWRISQQDFGGWFGEIFKGTNRREHYFNSDTDFGDSGGGSIYNFRKRKGTYGTPTAVVDTSVSGEILFSGYTAASSYQSGAYIKALVNGTTGSGDLPTDLVFATSPDGSATPVERARITTAGILNLGLATGATGQIDFNGTTSGKVSLKVADVAGTWTMTLPANDGNSGQFLQTDGAGVTTWADSTGGGFTWNEVTGTSQAMAVDNGYICNNGSLVTCTIPSTAAVGKVVRVTGSGAGGWKIAQNASEIIHFLSSTTTTGTGGYLASTNIHDSVELVCIVADTEWVVVSSVGNIIVN